MKQLLFGLLFLFSFHSLFANDTFWGQTGHRVTGEIAQKHLTKKAQREVERILGGKSLAFVSTYADEIKSDSKYREFGPWHYVNLAEGEKDYNLNTANPDGDLLQAISKCVQVLKDKNSSREDKDFYLKMLVHFVGDLHQPLHAGRGEDKGGNDIQVRWFNEGSNLHRVWDSDMINSFQMGYVELTNNTNELTKQQKEALTKGSYEDWMFESKALAERVYASVEVGEKLGYRYMYDWFPVAREQMQKGGIRLAYILNDIFG